MPYFEKETGPNGEERYVQKTTPQEKRTAWIVVVAVLFFVTGVWSGLFMGLFHLWEAFNRTFQFG